MQIPIIFYYITAVCVGIVGSTVTIAVLSILSEPTTVVMLLAITSITATIFGGVGITMWSRAQREASVHSERN